MIPELKPHFIRPTWIFPPDHQRQGGILQRWQLFLKYLNYHFLQRLEVSFYWILKSLTKSNETIFHIKKFLFLDVKIFWAPGHPPIPPPSATPPIYLFPDFQCWVFSLAPIRGVQLGVSKGGEDDPQCISASPWSPFARRPWRCFSMITGAYFMGCRGGGFHGLWTSCISKLCQVHLL
jgi:hypothetical protein